MTGINMPILIPIKLKYINGIKYASDTVIAASVAISGTCIIGKKIMLPNLSINDPMHREVNTLKIAKNMKALANISIGHPFDSAICI